MRKALSRMLRALRRRWNIIRFSRRRLDAHDAAAIRLKAKGRLLMTDLQAQKFVAALDKIDVALLAIRMEFEEQVRISAGRLAALKAAGDERRANRPKPESFQCDGLMSGA